MTILYTIGNSVYVNMTNKCPCACTFCVRQENDCVHGSENLWLDHDPSVEEIKAEFEKYNLDSLDSVVFCGYGEPLVRLNEVIEICDYIKAKSKVKIRVNTNGLADLVHKKDTAALLAGKIDAVSISLNAPTKEEYMALARPAFGEISFDAMLKFAENCKKVIGDVTFTVVDMLSSEQLEACRKIAEDRGIKFRVRPMI